MKQGRISWLVCAALLLGATAATAQPACDSLSPEVREYVRGRGACREAKKAPRPKASTQSKSGAAGSPASAPQNQSIPHVIGRSYTDAARALAKFKVERIETASAAPAGEVLAQEPAPAALGRPGSTVILQVSDGSLAGAASTSPVTAPATAAAATSAPAPGTTAAPLPPQEPINPVTAPATAAAASSAPLPATSLAPTATAVPLPPQEPIDPPGARGQFPTAFVAIAALIFGAGVLFGLWAGTVLMRQRMLRRQLAVGESAPPPTLPQRQQPVDQQPVDQQPVDQQPVDQQPVDQQPVDQQPVDQQPVDQQPVDQQPVDQQPVDQQPVDQQPVDQQPVDQQPVDQQPVDQRPAESDASGLSETGTSPEIRCAARLVPAATTIALAPLSRAAGISIEHSSDYHQQQVRLHAPIEVSGDDVERALFEQSRDESAVARVFERLRGAAAEGAADELNRALDVDILDVLAQGWVQVPAMHRAVQLSALTRGPPPMLLKVERHNIASTSHLVLDTRVAGSSLPPLELVLEIVADVQSATLAAREGRIDLVALGEATVLALLKYKSVVVKEHATEITGTPRDPSESRPTAIERPASVDFQI